MYVGWSVGGGFGGPVTALCASVHAFRWLVRSFVRNTHARPRTHQLTASNKIGDEGAVALAVALEQNATLEKLYLRKMNPCVVKRGG